MQNYLKMLPLIILSVSFLWACGPQQAQEAALSEAAPLDTVPRCSFFETPNQTCINARDTLQIDSTCAVEAMANWQCEIEYIDEKYQLDALDSKFLVKAFHIPRGELDSMLTILGDDMDVWATMAIAYNNVDKAFETRIVFAGQSAEGGQWQFFDFTVPCPNVCGNAPPGVN